MKAQSSYIPSLVATVLLTVLGLMTLLPMPASKPNVLGYFAMCSWSPFSTLILLGLAGLNCIVRAQRKQRVPVAL